MEIITASHVAVETIGVFDFTGKADNRRLREIILSQGDRQDHKSNVKADMTEWNLCYEYREFADLGIQIVTEGIVPYLISKYKNENDVKRQTFSVVDMWGGVYHGNSEHHAESHDHRWTHTAFCYYLQVPENCAPLVFDDLRTEIQPKESMLVTFDGQLMHSVPPRVTREPKIVIAGNVSVIPNENSVVHSVTMCNFQRVVRFSYI